MYRRIIKVDIDGLENTLSYPELKIIFSGEIDDDNEADEFDIKIYNLSERTRNNIKKESSIRLQAGYQDNFGTLTVGEIQSVESYKKKANYVTEITMTTASKSWTDDIINKTFNPPITSKQILERIIPSTGLEQGLIELVDNKNYQLGKTVNGRAINVIKQIAKESNTPITISNGKINFTNGKVNTGYLLSADSGLISSPRAVDNKDDEADWNIQVLFNHNIKPKSRIKVESNSINGQFDVVKAKFNEDFTVNLYIKEV